MSAAADATEATSAVAERRRKQKQKLLDPLLKPSSSSTSSKFSYPTTASSSKKRGIRLSGSRRHQKLLSGHRPAGQEDIGALAFPLGMSIAAVAAQVLKRKDAADDNLSVDHLSKICTGAVRESLVNVYGDKFDGFLENFEKSFRSTLMTLHSINKSAKANGEEKENPDLKKCSSEVGTASSSTRLEKSSRYFGDQQFCSDPLLQATSSQGQPSNHEEIGENMVINTSSQLILHDSGMMQQVASAIPTRSSSEFDSHSIQNTLEKSVMEQVRSNNLKAFEMQLAMRKLLLKERQLDLSSQANLLERFKLSFGISKNSFAVEKFKTKFEDKRHAELLRKCIDYLVTGLLVMLACVGYGAFIYSHKRISEATASCTPAEDSKSWWMPKSMSSFNSRLQILVCQFQVLTRMLAGGLLVLAIAYLLLQRSVTANQSMPVTFLVLLLAVACGVTGKLCIDTLGGSGNHWLLFWEILCGLHLFSNLWTSILYRILHGPINVTEGIKNDPFIPYWLRRCVFFGTTCLFLPLLCGFLPFASPGEWKDHFCLLIMDDRE